MTLFASKEQALELDSLRAIFCVFYRVSIRFHRRLHLHRLHNPFPVLQIPLLQKIPLFFEIYFFGTLGLPIDGHEVLVVIEYGRQSFDKKLKTTARQTIRVILCARTLPAGVLRTPIRELPAECVRSLLNAISLQKRKCQKQMNALCTVDWNMQGEILKQSLYSP